LACARTGCAHIDNTQTCQPTVSRQHAQSRLRSVGQIICNYSMWLCLETLLRDYWPHMYALPSRGKALCPLSKTCMLTMQSYNEKNMIMRTVSKYSLAGMWSSSHNITGVVFKT